MRAEGRSAPLVLALLVAVVATLVVVQVRSQAEVRRSLAQTDTASLAFQIDDLHRSNDTLAAEATQLRARRDALRSGGAMPSNGSALASPCADAESAFSSNQAMNRGSASGRRL